MPSLVTAIGCARIRNLLAWVLLFVTMATGGASAFGGQEKSSDKGLEKGQAATQVVAPATPSPTPVTATIGMYLFDLRNINLANGTFTCDFWIWSQSPDSGNILADLQFINADRVVWYVEGRPEMKGETCFKRRGTGTFRTSYRLTDYPYDAQKLTILMESSLKDAGKLVLQPDTANSGISAKNFPPEWMLSGFCLAPGKVILPTNLGDPNLQAGHGEFSRLEAVIDIRRASSAEYWGMTSTAYVAAILMLISFFMDAEVVGTRYAILGAAFLATVLSLKSTVGSLGDFGTRADRIHLIVIGFIFASLLCTLFFNTLIHRKVDPHKIRVHSAILGGVFFVAFVIGNLILLHHHAGS